jgi:hypothetical protein
MSSPPISVNIPVPPAVRGKRAGRRNVQHLRQASSLSALDIQPKFRDGARVGFETEHVEKSSQEVFLMAQQGAEYVAQNIFSNGGGAERGTSSGGGAGTTRHRHAHSAVSHRDIGVFHCSNFEEHVLSVVPTLTTRRGCLIVCLYPLKALITAKRALVFFERGADQIIECFLEKLEHSSGGGVFGAGDVSGSATPAGLDLSSLSVEVETSFEYCILSSILSTFVVEMDSNIAHLKSLVELASSGKKTYSDDDILEVGQRETDVNEMIKHLEDVLRVSSDVLDQHEDVESMVMSYSRYRNDELTPDSNSRPELSETEEWREEVVEFEELLEWFSSTVSSSVGSLGLFKLQLNTERARISHALQIARNRIAQLQLVILLATLGMAACSVVSGFYGMNLGNGTCGPEGCIVLGTTDSGYSVFLRVVGLSVGFAALAVLLIFAYAQTYIVVGMTTDK